MVLIVALVERLAYWALAGVHGLVEYGAALLGHLFEVLAAAAFPPHLTAAGTQLHCLWDGQQLHPMVCSRRSHSCKLLEGGLEALGSKVLATRSNSCFWCFGVFRSHDFSM